MKCSNSLVWSEPTIEHTRTGRQLVREAEPSPLFVRLYKNDTKFFNDKGFILSNEKRGQKVYHYKKLDDQTEVSSSRLCSDVFDLSINSKGLLKYQIPAVKRLVRTLGFHSFAVDMSDGGVGKSFHAAAVARQLKMRLGIICPKSVIDPWCGVAEKIGAKVGFIVNWERIRRGTTPWLKIKDNGYGSDEFEWEIDDDVLLVFDEFHKAKGEHSLNCDLVVSARKKKCTGLLLSATPASRPSELRALGYCLDFHRDGTSFRKWQEELESRLEHGQNIMANLHNQIFPEYGVRIRIADLGDQFPDTQIKAEAYTMGEIADKIQASYDLMEREIEKLEAADIDGRERTRGILVALLRARQRAEYIKVPLFKQLALEAQEQGYSVPIFLNFSKSIEKLAHELDTKCIIWGANKGNERTEYVGRFQADEVRFLVANQRAGGVGLSLHDLHGNHPRFAIISPTWSCFDFRQTTFRVHRAGGKTKSLQRIVFVAGTVEERVMQKVQLKLNRLDSLNDGDLAIHEKYVEARQRV